MTKLFVLAALWASYTLCLIIKDSEANKILHPQIKCEDIDFFKLIEFPYDDMKCLQVAINHKLPCISKSLTSQSIPLRIISHASLKNRDVSIGGQGQCETFLIFLENFHLLNDTFQSIQGNKTQFFPLTKIYFYFTKSNSEYKLVNKELKTNAKNFFITNALFGYIFELTKDRIRSKMSIIDLLTNDIKQSDFSYTPSDLLHPILDTRLTKSNFRISLYNCKPFAFYPEDADDKVIENQMDGNEFRLINEVTKNWKKTYNFRDFSRTKVSPYITMMEDLSNKSCDMAMCSIWLLNKYYESYDMTTFFDQHCVTFIVPKPKKLNEATSIYTALNTSVWLLFLFSFLSSSISLHLISKIEKRLYERNSVYTNFTSAVMETVNTATSHSVNRFPNGQISIEILLTSWILLSMWMGISYTTIFTSRFTSPGYEIPINTVRQFLDYGLHICTPYLNKDSIEEFRTSINADYRRLSTRSLVYGEDLLLRQQMFFQRKCGLFVHHTTKKYISERSINGDKNLLPMFKMMQDCVSRHYSGFALQKYSHTKLFNWHIRRYQEHGIIQKWYLEFSKDQKMFQTFFENYPKASQHKINLVNLIGAFFLLCTGLLLSLVQFVVEIIKNRRT